MSNCDTPEKFDIFEVAALSPKVEIANPEKNVDYILEALSNKDLSQTSFIVFPELCITGYTCGDLFFQESLIKQASNSLIKLSEKLKEDDRLVALGVPLIFKGRLFNCAVVVAGGKILGAVPKINIPNYQEFYEKRWFSSGLGIENQSIEIGGLSVPFGTNLMFCHKGVNVGLEICEDLWVPSPPSTVLCANGADLILNLSATDDNIGKYDYINSLVASQSARCRCAYAYASAGNGESSTDLVFSGIDLIAVDGKIVSSAERFGREAKFAKGTFDIEKLRNDRKKYSSFYEGSPVNNQHFVIESGIQAKGLKSKNPGVTVDPYPFIPSDENRRNENCREIIEIQSWGLAQRLQSTGCKHLVVGISGGLDSTLALLVAHYTFKSLNYETKGITGVTMPSRATSNRTHNNAATLMQLLGVNSLEISVKDAVDLHFRDIGHAHDVYDTVYENSQARERTQILMDLSNKFNGMVLGTGDMSELALGWCTYNGDHMSMYNVNAGVPKTLVKHIVGWFASTTDSEELKEVLNDIINTPISPELIPAASAEEIAQKTEDLVGPYELHDFFLYNVIRNGFRPVKIFWLATIAFQGRYTPDEIKKWLINFYKRFFSQQFKRSCMPDGPKVGSICLSPRGDWRMPSDASSRLWLKELETLICNS